jgi:tetratricopeptide (TPR) repeat protein
MHKCLAHGAIRVEPGDKLMAILTRLLSVLAAALVIIIPAHAKSPAGWPQNDLDLAILPEYCKYTQILMDISKLPRDTIQANYSKYFTEYGPIFYHMHHYCVGLFQEFRGDSILLKGPRINEYHQALNNVDYVLNKNPPSSFTLLPEIYTTKGRILLKMGEAGEAIGALNKAIELKPGYEPAYIQFSEYYLSIDRKDKAIAILEKGVENNPSPRALLRRLERLGKPYKGVPGSALAKQVSPMGGDKSGASTNSNAPAAGLAKKNQGVPSINNSNQASSNTSNGQSDMHTPASPYPPNPYCRFCP